MIDFLKKKFLSCSVKEALDNLPSGICFFDSNGILMLCNRRMYSLAFLLMGHDLQTLGDLRAADVTDGGVYHVSDGSWWSFSVRELAAGAGKRYTEVKAFDITDLHAKQELLQEANEAKRQTVETLERIQNSIVSIAREEEILSMKMELHNEFGAHLQLVRRFYEQGCLPEEKEEFLAGQRKMLKKLRGELGNIDAVDPFEELKRLAQALDMTISVTGELPENEEVKDLFSEALRESLTNAIRHAGGNRVFLELTEKDGGVEAFIMNNGDPPEREIVESGGLLSLRKRVEGFGGTMSVRSRPEFLLRIWLPVEET